MDRSYILNGQQLSFYDQRRQRSDESYLSINEQQHFELKESNAKMLGIESKG